VRPLFERWPISADGFEELATLPTPVEPLTGLSAELGVDGVYVKRDDLTGERYGGNKVRKLEFVLGQAVADKARSVMTVGYAGSNHALATAIYAGELGLGSISMLLAQPAAPYVAENLLAGAGAGAELHHYRSMRTIVPGVITQMAAHSVGELSAPRYIPAGASSPAGALGLVNAAAELAAQIDAGLLPTPDRIYLAFSSMGSTVGLALGLRALGIDTTVVAVRVVDEGVANVGKLRALYRKTNNLLAAQSPFPLVPFDQALIELRHSFFGTGYGETTEASTEAVALASACDGLALDGTYTGKAFAALLADARSGVLDGRTALFWNTYNSRDLTPLTHGVRWQDLPRGFHRYFTAGPG
jgi:D-cysteine desulfhydrase